MPLALACGGNEEPARPTAAPAAASGGGTYYGGGGGSSAPPMAGGGGRIGGGGGGSSNGGEIGDAFRRNHRERERWLREEAEKRGPVRLTDDYHSEHPEYAIVEGMINDALAERRPEDDDCEQQWTIQEHLLEENDQPHGASERNRFLRTCRATPTSTRRCGDAAYYAAHEEECERDRERAAASSRGLLNDLENGDEEDAIGTIRAATRGAGEPEEAEPEASVLPEMNPIRE